MIGDSQTPYFSVVKNTTAVVAIADWTNNALRGVDEISAHNLPPRRIGRKMSQENLDIKENLDILAVKVTISSLLPP